MAILITGKEFINSTLGLPWRDRATGPDAYDCYGLIIEYYRQVHGIALPEVSGYSDGSTSIIDGFFQQVESGMWKQSQEGIVFMAFVGDEPTHCGVVIGDMCLHAMGGNGIPGQVCYHRMRAMRKLYPRIETWEYVGDRINSNPNTTNE